ncbi:hypothetical protein LCGC14_1151870 [marine sediment metagenome]|uniref:Uncharacterized protein n=1 Tax=marine sediment metagenome TaxID=412755 RepID=A0A0F9LV84_9ZZZZ
MTDDRFAGLSTMDLIRLRHEVLNSTDPTDMEFRKEIDDRLREISRAQAESHAAD